MWNNRIGLLSHIDSLVQSPAFLFNYSPILHAAMVIGDNPICQ